MEALLDELEARGGVNAALTAAGVTATELDALRRAAVE
jgi:hypothetical protein